MSSPVVSAVDVADVLPAVLAQRSRTSFERLLAADVRWGGQDDTEQTCHDRRQAADAYAALLAGGARLRVLSTRVGSDQVLARLQVRQDDSADPGHQSQILLTVRDGLIVDILQLDDDEPPVIELLYLPGCPNHDAFLPHLQALLRGHEIFSPVQLVQVHDDRTAHQLRFLGSPSLRVDGQDVEPGADQRNSYGVQCRIYHTADGKAGTPADAWILAALQS